MTLSTERFAAAAHATRLALPGREAFAYYAHVAPYEKVAGFLRDQAGLARPAATPRGWRR